MYKESDAWLVLCNMLPSHDQIYPIHFNKFVYICMHLGSRISI